MKIFCIIGVLSVSLMNQSSANGLSNDSLATPIKKSNSYLFTTRVHTMGLFMYMGKAVTKNPTADIFFTMTSQSGFGFSVFKVADLNDPHSGSNFALILLNKSFHVGQKLTFTSGIGTDLEQEHRFVGHGSDVVGLLTTSLRINPKLVLEHTALFNNLIFEPENLDWVNRFRAIYSSNHIDLSWMAWHNNTLMDSDSHFTTGASIFYNRVSISNRVSMGAGLTALYRLTGSESEKHNLPGGIQFTTAFTFK